jgi:hypothetical protein
VLPGAMKYTNDFQRVAFGPKDDCARQVRHGPFTRSWLPAYATDVRKITEKMETRSEPPAHGFRSLWPVTRDMRLDLAKMRQRPSLNMKL